MGCNGTRMTRILQIFEDFFDVLMEKMAAG